MDKSIFDPPEWYEDFRRHKEISEKFKNGDYIKTVKIDHANFPESKIAKELSEMKEDMRDQRAKEEAEKPINKRFQILNSVISASVSSILTLAIEHHKEVFSFFGKVVEKFSKLFL